MVVNGQNSGNVSHLTGYTHSLRFEQWFNTGKLGFTKIDTTGRKFFSLAISRRLICPS